MAGRPRPRVFLDTNVIVSALHSPTGPPGEILRAHIEGKIAGVVSQQVLEELARTVAAKLPAAVPALQTLLLSAPPEVVPDPPRTAVRHWARLVELSDAPILAAAAEAEIDYFVTGDGGILAKAAEIAAAGVTVLSSRELSDRLQ